MATFHYCYLVCDQFFCSNPGHRWLEMDLFCWGSRGLHLGANQSPWPIVYLLLTFTIDKMAFQLETPVWCLHIDEHVSIDRSYLDYIKSGVFFYSFWITLMIVLITGTARISLFCMGYILACFIFLWFGEDMLLRPIRKLLSMWMGLLIYCYLVIMAKCVLQVMAFT